MLTLQYIPYYELQNLTSGEKIKKLLKITKTGKIALMEGRLTSIEEAILIETTMKEIHGKFKGVEICTIAPKAKNLSLWENLLKTFYGLLLGKREGLTIIGPATIIKEIRRDPNKITLLTSNSRAGRR